MIRLLSTGRIATALMAIALFTAAPSPAPAQTFAPGDIIVPGNRVVDGFGSTHGCFYRLRGGVVTPQFQSALFRGPRDMVIDAQHRLVFFAAIIGGNSNDFGLFRLDPATGTYERLYRFPYIVQPGDTIPNGAAMVTLCSGPSLLFRPSSLSGEPIMNSPAGTTTMPGQWRE